MKKFPKYNLTEKQIRGIANIVLHEQGTIAGWYAEASQIANRTDIKGDSYATPSRVVKTITSGWYAKGETRYLVGTKNPVVIEIVRNVFCKGLRTLPRYVDEHDCMSDIKSVRNGQKDVKSNKSKWERHKTVIKNRMGSTYYFYDFPGGHGTGVDPFGYTSKKYREKWGDDCYTVGEAVKAAVPTGYDGAYPVLPDKSFGVSRTYYQYRDGKTVLVKYREQIKRVQRQLQWAKCYKGEIDGLYMSQTVKAVKKFQERQGLPINGKFGKLCLNKMKTLKF